ncbi:hypothetical protein [Algoriphagus sp. CAU 1675]|uniref:hypothetical protein n=1 Tax=Algoriphagus sp. CAU 1675 TaxID=3032597 RepID=UPI0023DC4CB2|nr:hypothetical protein [Algoriphagus sp. CAU 1675]MDF2156248.1 hypothetical protein [Algoriphagus sp. CAU 1675]
MRTIEATIGSSNGTLSKAVGNDKDVQTKWISRFIEKYPEVNPVWLLTGKGGMLRDENSLDGNTVEEPREVLPSKRINQQNLELIETLKKLVESMEGQLQDKERLIQLKDKIIQELREAKLK